MLLITRKANEGVVIDGRVRVVVLGLRGGADGRVLPLRGEVVLGIDAPPDVSVLRGELTRR